MYKTIVLMPDIEKNFFNLSHSTSITVVSVDAFVQCGVKSIPLMDEPKIALKHTYTYTHTQSWPRCSKWAFIYVLQFSLQESLNCIFRINVDSDQVFCSLVLILSLLSTNHNNHNQNCMRCSN